MGIENLLPQLRGWNCRLLAKRLKAALVLMAVSISVTTFSEDKYQFIVSDWYDPIVATASGSSSVGSQGVNLVSGTLFSSSTGVDLESRYCTVGVSAGRCLNSCDFGFMLIIR